MNNIYQLFDGPNARNSSYSEVAETFVANDDFYAIAKNGHSFVLGPRGCGKTTLFKMLTPIARRSWYPENTYDINLKKTIDFIAIYIPSDELWKDQLRNITNAFKYDQQFLVFISNALININILTNFCGNIKEVINAFDLNDIEKEIEFSKRLITGWELGECISSISDVRAALKIRKRKFMNKLDAYLFHKKYANENKPIEFEEFFYSDFIDDIKIGISAFENVYFSGKEQKWALCFDELELISKDFINTIISKLRITPPNIVFKLSAGPLTEFENSVAQIFHDFEVVKMWIYNWKEEEKHVRFFDQIVLKWINKHLRKNGVNDQIISVDRLFGKLDYKNSLSKEFNFKIDINASEYESNSASWFANKELATRDHSFKEILREKVKNIEDPVPLNANLYDSFFRKTKEIVINRLIFNKYINGKYSQQRSLKEYLLYYGKEIVFRICEGNPRFIINIINQLLAESNDLTNLRFSPELQASVIKTVSARFNAMLNTYPTSKIYEGKQIDLHWLISKIGKYFEKEVNQSEFKVNPPTSFIVNENSLRPVIMQLIDIGVSLGAFVKLDNSLNDIVLDNKTRFRLSYLLHPEYKLPLRLYSSVALKKILHGSSNDYNHNNLFNYEN